MPSATQKDQIVLVPWDPVSAEHVKRLYEQRVQCGWDKQRVEGWREKQTTGRKCIFWITLGLPEDPQTLEMLQLHLNAFPSEREPLVDTAETLRAKPRTPSQTRFYAIGHISLDDTNEKPCDVLDLPKEGVYWIKTFYISKALRSQGIGRAAMDLVESMAIDYPLCAKTLALDTAQKDMQKKLHKEKTGAELGSTNQDWYERRGYRLIHEEPAFYVDDDEPPVDAVFLRRDIA